MNFSLSIRIWRPLSAVGLAVTLCVGLFFAEGVISQSALSYAARFCPASPTQLTRLPQSSLPNWWRIGILTTSIIKFANVSTEREPIWTTSIRRLQDDLELGRDAFSQREYPWYDPETDSIKRIEMSERTGAQSAARNKIPLAAPKTATTGKARNWGGGMNGLSMVVWVLIGAVLAGLIAVLVWAFLRLQPNQESLADAAPRRSLTESIKQLPFDLNSANSDFRQLAQQSRSAGDYRNALIFLFSHVLVSLDQQGLIQLQKGKTNREYLRELRSHRPLADYYQQVMVPFESVFFGDHDPVPAEFSDCWIGLDQFQTGIIQAAQVQHG